MYRFEINGLRAIAIIPVLLFHAHIPYLNGGFVGVDVFFVISGYLITMVIQKDLYEEKFSFVKFYSKRVARIVPNYFAVILVTISFGYFIQFPIEFRELGLTAASSAAFISNIFFWKTSGYFSPLAEGMPLLHTWSLSIEEQFYLFYPLILIAAIRLFRDRFRAIILGMTILSFILNVAMVEQEPNATFYLLPMRAWEIGVGALCSLYYERFRVSTMASEILPAAGLIMIIVAIMCFDESTVFPGLNALLPVAGSALFVMFAAGTTVGKLLSSRGFTYVGEISFSLYLWHWPVTVFYRTLYGPNMSLSASLIVIVISITLAILAFHLIEKRSRQAALNRGARGVVVSGVISLASIVAVGFGLSHLQSTRLSVTPEVNHIVDYVLYPETERYKAQFRSGVCFLETTNATMSDANRKKCLLASADKPNFLLLGDSHAAHLWKALTVAHPNYNIMQATASGCRPLLNAEGLQRCTDLMKFILAEYLPKNHVDGVLLAGRWRKEELVQLQETVSYMRKYTPRVVLLGPVAEYSGALPLLLGRRMLNNRDDDDLAEFIKYERFDLDKEMSSIFGGLNGVKYISIADIECPQQKCRMFSSNQEPMQFDYGHLTLGGAMDVATEIRY